MSTDDRLIGLEMLRRVHAVIARLTGNEDLLATMQAVADGVVHAVGFEVTAVSLLHADGMLEAVAVAGNDEARRQLLGRTTPLRELEEEFAVADAWGPLLFVPHDRLAEGAAVGWVPDIAFNTQDPEAWHPLDALYAPLRDRDGALVGLVSVDLPADRRRPGQLQRELLAVFASHAGLAISSAAVNDRLRASEASFRVAFDGAGSGMAVIGLGSQGVGRYQRVNPALCQLLDYGRDELLQLSPDDVTHPEDVLVGRPDLTGAGTGEPAAGAVTLRYLRRDGSTVWVAVTTSVVAAAAGASACAISVVEDVSERQRVEEELHRRAHHDPVTGLLNRHALTELLAAAVDRARATRRPGLVLFCDLDGFKGVNDAYGHDIGDQVLAVVADRIVAVLRGSDTALRIGGDEFLVVADALTLDEGQVLTDRLVDAVTAPIQLGDVTVRTGVSIGAQPITATADVDPRDIVRAADLAMYRTKRSAAGGAADTRTFGRPEDHSG